MDQSDNMLLATLRDLVEIPAQILSLAEVRVEEIFSISLSFLQQIKVDITELKSLRSQRFRSMAKLNQVLYQQLHGQFELNELMNPTVPFVRRLFLAFINQLAAKEEKKGSKGEKEENNNRKYKNMFKNWINDEWIHPSLISPRPKFTAFKLPVIINKNILKNNTNLSSQLSNPYLHHNAFSILSCAEAKHNCRVKQFQANEGIARKEAEEASIALQMIVKQNRSDWLIDERKIKKIKKKAEEKNQTSVKIEEESAFQKQVIEIQEEKKKENHQEKQSIATDDVSVQSENPLEKLKRQAENKKKDYQREIREILAELKAKKQEIQRWESQKAQIQQKITRDQQKIITIKSEAVQLKKKVEKRQNILSSIDEDKDIEAEVAKLQSQIKMIQSQAKQEVQSLQSEIIMIQNSSKQKMDALTDLKTKINKIQTDYTHVCQEIQDKQELRANVKIMKSGVSRLTFSKKISEVQGRWRETQREIKKMKANLEQLREKVRVSSSLSTRVETEIENLLNMDKNKNEAESKALKDIIKKCSDTFKTTLTTLEVINQTKYLTQEFQMKVHALMGKNYKSSIEKINFALEDLRREVAELTRGKK